MRHPRPASSVPAPAPRIVRSAPWIARLPPVSVAGLAAAVLLGWILHIDLLRNPFTGAGMKANTALGLLILALAVLGRRSPAPEIRRAITAGAGLLVLLSLLTSAEYAFPLDLHIDQLFAADSASTAAYPGRMSLLTALSFGLMGVTLLVWDTRTKSGIWPAHVLLFITAGIAFAAMVFHLYGVGGVELIAQSSDMSVYTALAFQAIVIAALAARLDRGLVAVICSHTDGAAAARRFLVAAVLLVTTLGYLRLAGERAGLYSTAVGTSLLVDVNVFVFAALILWGTRTLIQAEGERRQLAEELQAVMDVMPAAIGIAHDPACTRITGNPFLIRMMGLPPGANVSKSAPSGAPQNYQIVRNGKEVMPHDLPMQIAAREHKTIYDWECDVVRDDGSTVTVLGNAAPLLDAHQRVRGSVGAFVDITDRKRAETERELMLAREREARAAAEAANRSKDEFVSNLSHELRTPLNAILGWLRLLRSGKLTPARQEHAIETIERNATAQLSLVEDLLDLSGVVTGKLQLDIRPVDLAAVAEAAIETSRPAAQAKHIELNLRAQIAARPCAGDPRRLEQVFSNLISNAVKFTPNGGSVDVSLEYTDDTARIAVRDTGHGISPQFLPYVFDRFRQEDTGSTRLYSGMGLGLAIAKHIVELHEGSVSVESRGRGTGAKFVVTLPLVPAVAARARSAAVQRRAEASSREPTEVSLQGISVLVVEDDPDGRALLVFILMQSGATVVGAGSVAEALEILRRQRPQVVVTDIGMAEADGFDLIRHLRRDPDAAVRSIPAVAVTGYARSEDRTRTLAAGFQAHLSKPVNATELCVTIAALGRLSSATARSLDVRT
jgi:signal transduction histidine kinase/CheY-like chemotaxis protein